MEMLRLDRDDVTCPICLDILYEPVLTPCGHDYCHHCIERHISTTPMFAQNQCPLCREEFEQYAKNPRLRTQIDKMYPDDVGRRKRSMPESQYSRGRIPKRPRPSMFLFVNNQQAEPSDVTNDDEVENDDATAAVVTTANSANHNFWTAFMASFQADDADGDVVAAAAAEDDQAQQQQHGDGDEEQVGSSEEDGEEEEEEEEDGEEDGEEEEEGEEDFIPESGVVS